MGWVHLQIHETTIICLSLTHTYKRTGRQAPQVLPHAETP